MSTANSWKNSNCSIVQHVVRAAAKGLTKTELNFAEAWQIYPATGLAAATLFVIVINNRATTRPQAGDREASCQLPRNLRYQTNSVQRSLRQTGWPCHWFTRTYTWQANRAHCQRERDGADYGTLQLAQLRSRWFPKRFVFDRRRERKDLRFLPVLSHGNPDQLLCSDEQAISLAESVTFFSAFYLVRYLAFQKAFVIGQRYNVSRCRVLVLIFVCLYGLQVLSIETHILQCSALYYGK